MDINRLAFRICLLLIVSLANGCSTVNGSSETTIQMASHTSIVDGTPSFTGTPDPSLSPSTILHKASPSPLISTLPYENAISKLLNLVADNGKCQLPCLWGITPGKSTYSEMVNILLPIGSVSIQTLFGPESGFISPKLIIDDLIIKIGVSILSDPENHIVNYVNYQAGAYKVTPDPDREGSVYDAQVFDSEYFGNAFKYYMLNNILSIYGRPTYVYMTTNPTNYPSGPFGYFNIFLLYTEQGFIIQYMTTMRILGSSVIGCPSNAYIDFVLLPLEKIDNYYNYLSGDMKLFFDSSRPIEEVTSITVDQFYLTFKEPTEKCIETPINYWPTLSGR